MNEGMLEKQAEPLQGTVDNSFWQEGREHTWKERGCLELNKMQTSHVVDQIL